MELTAPELWSRVLDSARRSVPDQSFRTWLGSTKAISLLDGELVVEAPSEFHVEWIEGKYLPLLTEILVRILGRPHAISFRSAERLAQPLPGVELTSATRTPPVPEVLDQSAASLNDRYTFARFVVGKNSELAAAACRAVAETPARLYNPLFLYGGVGLGKTHLMHAIGLEMLERDPTRVVAYVTSEQFMNDLVQSIQEGTTREFRRRYRKMDLLLVDDVHFLEGRERTQEEFFHTFNALYDARKQIVVTSDRPPKELPGLEERLVSRFEWGLVVDLRPPDYETRVAILRKKGSDDALALDDAIIDFIARSCTSSVRELEGAVIKLLAYSSLTHQELTVDLARRALQGMIAPGQVDALEGPSPEWIRERTAHEWGVTPESLASKRRTRDVTEPRQVAMYLIKEVLHLPLVQIGRLFGGRDHSTVIHSVDRVEEKMSVEPAFAERVRRLYDELRGLL